MEVAVELLAQGAQWVFDLFGLFREDGDGGLEIVGRLGLTHSLNHRGAVFFEVLAERREEPLLELVA
jgi:hypothetical protein